MLYLQRSLAVSDVSTRTQVTGTGTDTSSSSMQDEEGTGTSSTTMKDAEGKLREKVELDSSAVERLQKSATEYWRRTYLLFGVLAPI